jgi:hypothetical protein
VARRVLSAALQRAGVWSLPGLDQPGRYMATELRGGVALGARPLVVMPPDSESDLTPAALGALAGAQPTPQRSGGLASAPGWTLLLVLLVLLLLAESAALARGARQLRWPAWLLRWLPGASRGSPRPKSLWSKEKVTF